MNWRTKARIAKLVTKLPASLSDWLYCRLQRSFGRLRRANPTATLHRVMRAAEIIESQGKSLVKSMCFELGTGRSIETPLALWLFGAKKIITVDVNPYLKEMFVRRNLEYIRDHCEEIRDLFGGRIYGQRLEDLVAFTEKKWRLPDVMEFCSVTYLAPCDASKLPIASASVDFYVSILVLQHVHTNVLKAIFMEGNRIVKERRTLSPQDRSHRSILPYRLHDFADQFSAIR